MTKIWNIFGYFIISLTPLTEGVGYGGCVLGDQQFKNGEYFFPNDPELLSTELPGQCMQCNCKFGVVFCELVTCKYLNCNGPQDRLQPCCQQCFNTGSFIDKSAESDTTSDLIFPAPKPNKARKKSDCISDGKVYKDGSSWQPSIGPLGTMSCVQCGCVNGEVACKRFPCRELPCSHPRKQFGHCCPVCPLLETSTESNVQCLPRSSEVFVFKRPKMGKKSDIIEYGFIQSSSRNKLDLHIWDTNQPDENQLNMTNIMKTAQSLRDRNLTIAGATSFKHWTRFVKREKRLKGHCRNKCGERVVRLEETLKLYPVASRARCRPDEIDTNGL